MTFIGYSCVFFDKKANRLDKALKKWYIVCINKPDPAKIGQNREEWL